MVKRALIERVKCPFCGSKNLQSIYKKLFKRRYKKFSKKHLNRFPLKILEKKILK